MSIVCVNLNSPEVKKLAGELKIHPLSLEVCIHDYWNSPYGQRYFAAHGDYPFPGIDYVRDYFFGGNPNTGELAIMAWARGPGRRHYGELYNSQDEYIQKDAEEYAPIVGYDAMHVYRALDGTKVFKISRPKLRNGEELIMLLEELGLIHKWGSKKYRLTKSKKLSDASVRDSFFKALDTLNLDHSCVKLTEEGSTTVVTPTVGFGETQYIPVESELLFQKVDLSQQLDVLRAYTQPLKGKGSLKNIITYIKGLKGVDQLIKTALVKAVETNSSLTELSPYDLWCTITKQRDNGLAKEYNQYLEQPVNEALEQHLMEYLEPFHIDIKESGVAETYGVAGVFDIINKTIHLAKDRNAITMTEEFAHAFVELMGSVTSNREENKDYTFLFNNVEQTDLYSQVFEQYKDTYVTKDDRPDIDKIRKEAIGQALAVAINNKWNNQVSEAETSFWSKLKEWFNKILQMFSNSEYINFETLTNKIASEIISKDYTRLSKIDASNYSLLDYSETLAKQSLKDGGKAVSMMQYFTSIGNAIAGSLSFRRQGTIYRGATDALHDIDMEVPPRAHGIDLQDSIIRGIINRAKRNNDELISVLTKTPYFEKVLRKYPKMKFFTAFGSVDNDDLTISGVYSEDTSLSERFAAMKGSYAKRLESFTQEERDQIYLFDFFLKSEEKDYITDTDNNLRLTQSNNSFVEKLKMGRAKDIFDYQMFNTFEDFKSHYTSPMEHLMLQKQEKIPFNFQQNKAIGEVSEFLLDKDAEQDYWVIEGVAGSGKTTIIDEILKEVHDKDPDANIAVGAVANKAVEVLSSKIEVPHNAGSCAAILGLLERHVWDPQTDEVYEEWFKPEQPKDKKKGLEETSPFGKRFVKTDILIVDECSMLNEEQLNWFLNAKKAYDAMGKKDKQGNPRKLKIVFIGDPRQAPPIRNSKSNVRTDAPSPSFTGNNLVKTDGTKVKLNKSILTERVRQGTASPVPIFSDIPGNWAIQPNLDEEAQKATREYVQGAAKMLSDIKNSSSIISEGGALCLYNDTSIGASKTVINMAVPLFEQAIADGNPNLGKIVCAHVDAVRKYNAAIQSRIHPQDSQVTIHNGDPIMFYSSYEVNEFTTFHNSHEFMAQEVSPILEEKFDTIVDFIGRFNPTLKDKIHPIKYQWVTVYHKETGNYHSIKMIVPSDTNLKNYHFLINTLNELATRAYSQERNFDKGKIYSGFVNDVTEIADIQFSYAISAHKSQGSTYDTVIVDSADIFGKRMPNSSGGTIGGFSTIAQAKLLYTGITRASNVTVMVGNFPKAQSPKEDIVTLNNRIRQFKGKPISARPITKREQNSIKEQDASQGMKATEKMWEDIFKDIDTHNEKIDTETQHAYYYYPNGKEDSSTKQLVDTSVTTVVNPPKEDSMWLQVASRIGTATDGIVRDFFEGKNILESQYPNYNQAQLEIIYEDLKNLRSYFNKRFAGKQYKVISSEHPLIAKYVDDNGETHTVGGTIDLLLIDEDGNYYIYDVKTSRSEITGNEEKIHHYESQVNFYRQILEANYPQLKGKCKGLGIVQFNLFYPAPKGARLRGGLVGTANYSFNKDQVKLEGVDIQDTVANKYKAPHSGKVPFIQLEQRVADSPTIEETLEGAWEVYTPVKVLPLLDSPKTLQEAPKDEAAGPAAMSYADFVEAMNSGQLDNGTVQTVTKLSLGRTKGPVQTQTQPEGINPYDNPQEFFAGLSQETSNNRNVLGRKQSVPLPQVQEAPKQNPSVLRRTVPTPTNNTTPQQPVTDNGHSEVLKPNLQVEESLVPTGNTFNVHFGANDNSSLSNFAPRPFDLQLFEGEDPIHFDNVEQAFQYIKFRLYERYLGIDESTSKFLLSDQPLTGELHKMNTRSYVKPGVKAKMLKANIGGLSGTIGEDTFESVRDELRTQEQKILDAPTGAAAKRLGGKNGGYNISGNSGDTFLQSIWNYGEQVAYDVMKSAIRQSLNQNPDAQKALLDSGNQQITHFSSAQKNLSPQQIEEASQGDPWVIQFPQILTELRQELQLSQQQNDMFGMDETPTEESLNALKGILKEEVTLYSTNLSLNLDTIRAVCESATTEKLKETLNSNVESAENLIQKLQNTHNSIQEGKATQFFKKNDVGISLANVENYISSICEILKARGEEISAEAINYVPFKDRDLYKEYQDKEAPSEEMAITIPQGMTLLEEIEGKKNVLCKVIPPKQGDTWSNDTSTKLNTVLYAYENGKVLRGKWSKDVVFEDSPIEFKWEEATFPPAPSDVVSYLEALHKGQLPQIVSEEGTVNWEEFDNITEKYFEAQPNERFSSGTRYNLKTRLEKHETPRYVPELIEEVSGYYNDTKIIKLLSQEEFKKLRKYRSIIESGTHDEEFDRVIQKIRHRLSPNRRYEQSTHDHTYNVVQSAMTLPLEGGVTRQELVQAALLHDLGKPFKNDDHGKDSEDIINDLFPQISEVVKFAVRWHMVNHFMSERENPNSVFTEIINDAKNRNLDVNKATSLLLLLNQTDILSGRNDQEIDDYTHTTVGETRKESYNLYNAGLRKDILSNGLALNERYTPTTKIFSAFAEKAKVLQEMGWEVTPVVKKSEDGKVSNHAILLSLKGQPNKGWFEIVADKSYNDETKEYGEENNTYSLHFKTKSAKVNKDSKTALVPLTNDEKEALFQNLIFLIPDNAVGVSTWGTLSKGGIQALKSLAERSNGQLRQVGTRTLKEKTTGNNIEVPIYAKQNTAITADGKLPKYTGIEGVQQSNPVWIDFETGNINIHYETFNDINYFINYIKGEPVGQTGEKQKIQQESMKILEDYGYSIEHIQAFVRNRAEAVALLVLQAKSKLRNNFDFDKLATILNPEQLEALKIQAEALSIAEALREYEVWKQSENGKSYNPKSVLTKSLYIGSTPLSDKEAAFMFGENAQFAMTATNQVLPQDIPTINKAELRVGAGKTGTNQAVIRTDDKGVPYPNSCGIVVKKIGKINGSYVYDEGNFKDTDEDFRLFVKLNLQSIAKARRFNKVVWPDELSLNKAALPLRFAQWLQNTLSITFGIETEIQNSIKYAQHGFGLKIKGEQDTKVAPIRQELVIAPLTSATSLSPQCAKHAQDIGGVNTLRVYGQKYHFGNPFSCTQVGKDIVSLPNVHECVKAFEAWLRGTAYQNLEQDRRNWIIQQINTGALDGKPLVYYTTKVASKPGEDYFGQKSAVSDTYDYDTRPNHAHILQKLILEHQNGEIIGQQKSDAAIKVTNPMTPASFINHTGGAFGGDTIWDQVGRPLGFTTHKHYVTERQNGLPQSSSLKAARIPGIRLTREEWIAAAEAIRALTGRSISITPNTQYVIRDFVQAKNADAIYALAPIASEIINNKSYVTGGTNNAVTYGIMMGKPVYVWDITTEKWHTWNASAKKFEPCEVPILTTNYAGVGSRSLENYQKYDDVTKTKKWTADLGEYAGNEKRAAAIKAVQEVFQKTLDNAKKTLSEEGATVVERTLSTLNDTSKVLSEDEQKTALEVCGTTSPKVLLASESTDPVFHAEQIKDYVQGQINIRNTWNAKKQEWKAATSEEEKARLKKELDALPKPEIHMMQLITKHDGLPLRELALLDIPKSFHFSITGLGNTEWEPGVMKPEHMLDRIEDFIKEGLINPGQVTIRVDPIVPGVTSKEVVERIVSRSREMGITKFRFSVMDSYGYDDEKRKIFSTIKEKIPSYDWGKYYNLDANGIPQQDAKKEVIAEWYDFVSNLADTYKVTFSTCGEKSITTQYKGIQQNDGCLNVATIQATLGINNLDFREGTQRPGKCHCYWNKKSDILSLGDECASSCIYCYARHNGDKTLQYYDEKGRLRPEVSRFTLTKPRNIDIEAIQEKQRLEEEARLQHLEATLLVSDEVGIQREIVNPRDLYTTAELQLIQARRNLMEASSTVFKKPTELRNLAKAAMFQLSDWVTRLTTDADAAPQIFPMDSKWHSCSFVGWDRIEVIRTIGLSTLENLVRDEVFNLQRLRDRGGRASTKTKNKFRIINENWVAFMEMAYSSLAELESISPTSMTLDQTATKAIRVLNSGEEELFDGQTAEEVAETLGSSLEHWQIGFRQLSAFSSLTKLLKNYINTIKETDHLGNTILDETYKMPVRADSGKLVSNILMWTQGCTTLSEMVSALSLHTEEAPSLRQIIEDLGENGKDETFKSQFFSNFKKYFQPYMIQYTEKGTRRLVMKIINEGNLQKDMAQSWSGIWKNRENWTDKSPMQLYNLDGSINEEHVQQTISALKSLQKFSAKFSENPNYTLTAEDTQQVKSSMKELYRLFDVELDDTQDKEILDKLVTSKAVPEIYRAAFNMIAAKSNKSSIVSNWDKKEWNPYEEGNRNNLETIFGYIVDYSTLNLESVSHENGKMHYSYVIPSYLSKLLGKIQGNVRDYEEFLEQEYGKYPWYKKNGKWRNEWVRLLAERPELREQFKHAVLLSQETKKGTKIGYTEKSPISYERSMLANYFYSDSQETYKQEVDASDAEVFKNYSEALQNYALQQWEAQYGAPLDSNNPQQIAIFSSLMSNIDNKVRNSDWRPFTWSTKKEISRRRLKSGTFGYFRIPMMSNKPSEEYIHFIKYGTSTPDWKDTIIGHLLNVAEQEIDRIATAELRAQDPTNANIKNFDGKTGNANKFVFLEYLQPYLTAYDKWQEGKSSKEKSLSSVLKSNNDTIILGKILREKIEAAKNTNGVISTDLYQEYMRRMLGYTNGNKKYVKGAIEQGMDTRYQEYLDYLRKEGMIFMERDKESLRNFYGLNMGTDEETIMKNLENFFWNDTFASINILQLTITDIAFYKDTEDLQKRLAQIHAPGLRANIEAKDDYGNYVALESSGRALSRTIYLSDFEHIVSDAIENVRNILYRQWQSMPDATDAEKQAKSEYKDIVDSLLESFKDINVADAQGYSCLTSYRKKAILFGKWGKDYEEMWQQMQEGGYKKSRNLRVALQPLKPFIYSQTSKESVGPLNLIKEGVQNKNSEYLLMMMDAILKGEGESGNCMLRAINEIMEETHQVQNLNGVYVAGQRGIDTVQFESTVKAGLQGQIDINEKAIRAWESTPGNIERWEADHQDWINSKEGKSWRKNNPNHPIPDTEIAKQIIRDAIYVNGKLENGYNPKSVHELDYEDYCLQSEVPAHLEGDSIFGSQLRILGIADMPETDSQGNPNYITVGIGKNTRTLTVKEAKDAYIQAVRDNIQSSMDSLVEELGLDSLSGAERNKKLSDLLVRQIREDNKDGYDILYACTTDEQGNFMMPLNDPVMATRIQQLLNSIIKSRINKQQMKGGPVVQVTNFGTGTALQIRFQDSKGKDLQTLKEFYKEALEKPETYPGLFNTREIEEEVEIEVEVEGDTQDEQPSGPVSAQIAKFRNRFLKNKSKTSKRKEKVIQKKTVTTPKYTWNQFIQLAKEEVEKTSEFMTVYKPISDAYQEYLKDANATIKYFECYAPSKVFAEEFPEAVDQHGNVNIEWFKQNGREDALHMIGYRIPTESKYSMAPLKIVGFLPYEAGEGIMLPKDITLLSGSDKISCFYHYNIKNCVNCWEVL